MQIDSSGRPISIPIIPIPDHIVLWCQSECFWIFHDHIVPDSGPDFLLEERFRQSADMISKKLIPTVFGGIGGAFFAFAKNIGFIAA